jgi:hypothetical protein
MKQISIKEDNMGNSEEMDVLNKFCMACDNFSSILKTIHLFDQFIDAGFLSIPEEDVEDVRNSIRAPLAIMLSCFQSDIEKFQNEMNEECEFYRNRAN